jgi:hypothetical protein
MRAINDINASNWLTKNIDQVTGISPTKLSHLLPDFFDNYIAVLWTPGLIDDFPFDSIVHPTDNIEQLNINIAIWRKFKIFLDHDNKEVYKPTTFYELANLFKTPFNRQIINILPWQSNGIKTLFKPTRLRIEGIIDELSLGLDLNLYIQDYSRLAMAHDLPQSQESTVFKVSTMEFLDFMDKTNYDASLYLYSEKKNWCLLNLEDLGYSILAYNNEFSNNIAQLNLKDTFIIQPHEALYEE